MIKFMNTKERCLQCGQKLEKAVTTKDNKNVCSDQCKSNWENN